LFSPTDTYEGGMMSYSEKIKIKNKKWNWRVAKPKFETANKRGRFKIVFWKVGNLEV
jgi:hypothetical protein